MKNYILIVFIFIVVSCKKTNRSSEKHNHMAFDTVYFTKQSGDPAFKAPSVILSSDSVSPAPFELRKDVANYVQVTVSNYPEYFIYLRELTGIKEVQKNAEKGEFLLVPTDSAYQFDIYLDFGEGNVLAKYEFQDSDDYYFEPYNGLRFIARVRAKSF